MKKKRRNWSIQQPDRAPTALPQPRKQADVTTCNSKLVTFCNDLLTDLHDAGLVSTVKRIGAGFAAGGLCLLFAVC